MHDDARFRYIVCSCADVRKGGGTERRKGGRKESDRKGAGTTGHLEQTTLPDEGDEGSSGKGRVKGSLVALARLVGDRDADDANNEGC